MSKGLDLTVVRAEFERLEAERIDANQVGEDATAGMKEVALFRAANARAVMGQWMKPLLEECERLAYALHMARRHPDFEYETTTCPRKQGPAFPPTGDGWEDNGEGHDCWERFEYHDEHYWRRRKPEGRITDDREGVVDGGK